MFDSFQKEPTRLERLLEQLGQISNNVVRFYQDSVRVAFLEAICAGLTLAFAFCVLDATEIVHETILTLVVKILLPTVGSFIGAWYCFYLIAKKSHLVIPSWLLIAVVGTFLALVLQGFPAAVSDLISSSEAAFSVVDYGAKWATILFTLLSILLVGVLPLTAAIHYLGSVFRLLQLED